jgi:hypothetical protein
MSSKSKVLWFSLIEIGAYKVECKYLLNKCIFLDLYILTD